MKFILLILSFFFFQNSFCKNNIITEIGINSFIYTSRSYLPLPSSGLALKTTIDKGEDHELLFGANLNYTFLKYVGKYYHLPAVSFPLKIRKIFNKKTFIESGFSVASSPYFKFSDFEYFAFGFHLGGGLLFELDDKPFVLNGGIILSIPQGITVANRVYSPITVNFTFVRKFPRQKKMSTKVDYWDNNDALFMDDLDSADNYLSKTDEERDSDQKTEQLNIEKRDTLKWRKDSIKLERTFEIGTRLRKNTVRVEVAGISGNLGLVYERNIQK